MEGHPDPSADRDTEQLQTTVPLSRAFIIQFLLRNALRLHRAGEVAKSERIYRQILALDPRHADSLHLLGMIAHGCGRCDVAVAMIRQAIAINPNQAAYYSNLGTILQSQGCLEEAAQSYSSAIGLQPDLAEAHYNLANILHAQNKPEEAVACYRRALAVHPNLPEAHYNLGNTLQALGNFDEAIACYRSALALDPKKYEALHNLGTALQSQDKLEDALACYEEVLAAQPGAPKFHYCRACALHAMGRLDEAIAEYRTARILQPDFAQATFGESLAQLLQGDFAAGWLNYESRWQSKDHDTPMRAYAQPLWAGEKLASGRVLIWGEQGIGDEIMFAGMIPDALRTGSRCLVDCDRRLLPLFRRSFPGLDAFYGHVTRRAREPNYSKTSSATMGSAANQLIRGEATDDPGFNPALEIVAHLPIGSLPRLFRSTESAFVAAASPYLVADTSAKESFRSRYSDGRKLVGLAWYTNNRNTGRIRSIELSLFAPLFVRRDICWVSLQYGNHDAIEKQAAAADAPLLIDRTVDQFADPDLFAAQIAALDLVVTIDNSAAHLAGALGVPTWILLPLAADWRWQLTRGDSPWYPTVRLFRQPDRGDWQSVLECVSKAL